MFNIPRDGSSPQTDKINQLNRKMVSLAQELLVEEMFDDSLFACGETFTTKLLGKYGRYETFGGQVVAFQPQFHLNFTLICPDFVVTSNLAMIRAIVAEIDDYELSISL